MLRFGSGSYNVRDSECIRGDTRLVPRTLPATVLLLDGTEEDFELERGARGQELLDKVMGHLELVERDYFGLQFLDAPPDEPDARRWLEPSKSIRKQMMYPPFHLRFQVKFYVSDPSKLQEEYTRYHFYLQLRRDLWEGRLFCSESSAALLGSYAVQSELGDYSPEDHPDGYLDSFQFITDQTQTLMRKIYELHKLHRGQTPADAEYNFLDHAKRLEMYGVDAYNAKDSNGVAIQLGVASSGLCVFQSRQRINTFSWTKILKLSFKRKQFFVQLKSDDNSEDRVVGFNLVSGRGCKLLWKSCIEHHTFFRLIAPPTPIPKGLFSLGSRYRFSGRTEYQSQEEMKRKARIERTFHRAGSKSSYARSTVTGASLSATSPLPSLRGPQTPAPAPTSFVRASAYAASESGGRLSTSWSAAPPEIREGSEKASNGAVIHGPGHQNGHGHAKGLETTFGASAVTSKVMAAVEDPSVTEQTFALPAFRAASAARAPAARVDGRVPNGFSARPPVVQQPPPASPLANGMRNGGSGRSSLASTSGGSGSPVRLNGNGQANGHSPPNGQANGHANGHHHGSVPSRASPRSLAGQANGATLRSSPAKDEDGGLVRIRIRPDAQGRFGFNVKGGCDQNYPIIVSRVAPGSPADTCYPRLHEGDQVLQINGRDVGILTHDQVVRFIRSARENVGAELELNVRPNVYMGEEVPEPEFQYVPEATHLGAAVSRSDAVSQSILLLKDSLSSGHAMTQFEQLYRKKPGMGMEVSKTADNAGKNRYRDVLPYDATRVRLRRGPEDPETDYINANYVNMEIPTSGIVNRYIAAQGPLPHTIADFWRVVWDELCTSVVMLTAMVERGRVKCHQYWPRLYESQDVGGLSLTCLREKETAATATREFSLINRETKEERQVTQLQYTAWPDHGVPDSSTEFLAFVQEVRSLRVGSMSPMVIHCSAGIGRTGVLILMETAACRIEANEPVYPLDLVRTMRDQRPMLIQTTPQYKFVCEALVKAYSEGSVKPLPEFQTR